MISTGSPGRVRPNGVVLVTIWFIIGAVLSLLGTAAILIFALPVLMRDTAGDPDRYLVMAGVSFGLFLLVVLGVLDVVAAVGLLRLRDWARWLAMVLAALGLILIPFGTIIGAVIIWYLLTENAKQAFGAALPQPTPKESIKADRP